MTKHPKSAAATPTPADIKAARLAAGLSQTAAAAVVYAALRSWQEWEAGDRPIHPAVWELFQIKLTCERESMFNTYGVVMVGSEKHRHFLGGFESIEKAKHRANCATLGNAAYAYVKDTAGDTVFHIKAIDSAVYYGENTIPLEQCRPVPPALEG